MSYSYGKRVINSVDQRNTNMVENSTGGYVFKLSPMQRLQRFLILGSSKNTYYSSAKKLTMENAGNILEILASKEAMGAIQMIRDISFAGRAPKNKAALFALSLACADSNLAIRRAAFGVLNDVARYSTDLFEFVIRMQQQRGWGVLARKSISDWYESKSLSDLAYQVEKYPSRKIDGKPMSHRDILRLAHVKPADGDRSALYYYVVNRDSDVLPDTTEFDYIHGSKLANQATSVEEIIQLINLFKLTRETVPNKWFAYKEVWEALLPHMPVGAIIRNLGKMTALNLFSVFGNDPNTELVQKAFEKKNRLHPLNILTALSNYRGGYGQSGLTWRPAPKIMELLENAFYNAFPNAESTGKNLMIALDVSGSMDFNSVEGCNLSAREVAAAMSLIFNKREKYVHTTTVSSSLHVLNFSKVTTLEQAVNKTRKSWGGMTNLGLSIEYALKKKIPADAFILFTDNEVNSGQHLYQLLEKFRREINPEARMITCGLTATDFSVAGDDPLNLDVVGFDSAIYQIVAGFIRGDY